ncbi:MAG: DNA gyrase subunit A [Patescibacteria group bacterium]|nr:DNA gyrase subunit A [Patescibacteria group bacterium]MDE1946049.1 DNA gyrase subunit A [Patescibacteria group bacterium]
MPEHKHTGKEPAAAPLAKPVSSRSITTEMKESFIDYAMSVITDRALPDVRDGLKPVHRRILFAMNDLNLSASSKTKKSATVVGDVLGHYHPHGDASVYDAMVKMAQDFSMRYPLVIGQGNFGSIDGDGAAAYRYTEAKMSRMAGEMLRDIDKETVEWKQNYDNTRKEPGVLPAAVPNLLLNGTLGIAVGMATDIPPHNLGEVVDATLHLIDDKDATTEDLLQFVKGPDFPTGGIIYNQTDINHAYATGRGGIVTRGIAEITEDKKGNYSIVITAIPFRVNKASLLQSIADLHREKKLEGIKDMRDESTKDIRIVIELKNNANPQSVLNYLYKHTQLEETFHVNVVALVGGVPKTLSLKGCLDEFIDHRKIVVKRRTEFDLAKAEAREHILLGLKKALDHIDEIIKLIKKSKDVDDARAQLMKTFKFSEIQANAILEMRLSKLAGLERKKVEDELAEVQALIADLKDILAKPKRILTIIKGELIDIKEKYGDERRTKVVKGGVKTLSEEDLIPDEPNMLVLTAGGYVKRTNPDEYRKQKRGGVGVVDLDTKDEDFITHFLSASAHSDILFFTNKGKAYQIKMYELPEGKRATKGKAIVNYLAIGADEKITSVLAMPKSLKNLKLSLILVTKQGTTKRVDAESFKDVRRSGLIAISLDAGDELRSALFMNEGDQVILATTEGQAIRFKDKDVRVMGRSAGGVRGMRLEKGDSIVAANVVSKDMKKPQLLVVSEHGYGKKTPLDEYKVQGRGGSGIITMKVTDKTGKIMAATVVTEEQQEIATISKKSQVIRTELSQIPSLGRQTQGVRIMKLRDGDSLASMTII